MNICKSVRTQNHKQVNARYSISLAKYLYVSDINRDTLFLKYISAKKYQIETIFLWHAL